MSPARHPALAVQVALLALALLLLGPALLGGRDFVPFDLHDFSPWRVEPAGEVAGNLDISEKLFLVRPDLEVARRELAAGRIPHWNPYIRTGAPLLGSALEGLLYPPHWLFFLMPPGRAFALLALFSFWLAGLFTFLLLRLWQVRAVPAAGGALFFAFSLAMTANAHFYMRQDTLALMPLLFWAVEHCRIREGKLGPVALALGTAGLWLAGFPPFALAVTLGLGAWILLKCPALRRQGGWAALRPFLLRVAPALGIGLLLAAPQLLSLAHYLPHSQRTLAHAGGDPRSWGADPACLLTLFVPELYGSPTVPALPYDRSPLTWLLFLWRREGVGLVAPYNFTETALYLGAPALLLALWGTLRPWPGRRRPLLILLGGSLFLALGLDWGFLAGLVPGLQSAHPLRLLVLPVLAGALFAARGLALLRGGDPPPRPVILAGIAPALAVALALLWVERLGEAGFSRRLLDHFAAVYRGPGGEVYTPEHIGRVFLTPPVMEASWQGLRQALAGALPRWAAAAGLLVLVRFRPGRLAGRSPGRGGASLLPLLALVALGLVDLLLLGRLLCPSFPARDPFAGTEIHAALARDARELTHQGGATLVRVGPAGEEPRLFPPNLPVGLGVRDLNAYAFVDRRSHRPLAEAWRRLAPQGPSLLYRRGPWIGPLPDSPLLEHPLLDLYGVTHLLARQVPRHGAGPLRAVRRSGEEAIHLLRRPGPVRRARVVPRAVPLADEAVLDRLADPGFAPDRIAFLPPGSGSLNGRGGGEVRFVEERPGLVRITVDRGGGGLLLLAETHMPGWRARVDGRSVPLLRADYCFLGVSLPAGSHLVEFRYEPPGFRLGLLLAAAGLVLGLLLLVPPPLGALLRRRG